MILLASQQVAELSKQAVVLLNFTNRFPELDTFDVNQCGLNWSNPTPCFLFYRPNQFPDVVKLFGGKDWIQREDGQYFDLIKIVDGVEIQLQHVIKIEAREKVSIPVEIVSDGKGGIASAAFAPAP